MRGKRFCLFVMAFVAMALCFMIASLESEGPVPSAPEKPQLEAIYDRPADSADTGKETNRNPKKVPYPIPEANPGKNGDVRSFGLTYAVMRIDPGAQSA